VLKFAEQNGMCSRQEIEDAITSAGHSLDEGLGGRTLGQEIDRQDTLPVLRGNLIMGAIMSRRTMVQGLVDAQQLPTLAARTGFEINWRIRPMNFRGYYINEYCVAKCTSSQAIPEPESLLSSPILAINYLTGRPWLEADWNVRLACALGCR
jgi:hypothetical protein